MTEKRTLFGEILLYMWLGTALFSVQVSEKTPFARIMLGLSEWVVPLALYVYAALAFYDFEAGRFPEIILLIVCAIYLVIATTLRLAIFLVLRYGAKVGARLVADKNRNFLWQERARISGFFVAVCCLALAPIPLAVVLGDYGAKGPGLLATPMLLIMAAVLCLTMSTATLAFQLWIDRRFSSSRHRA